LSLLLPKGKRRLTPKRSTKDEAHLRLIRQCPCLACGIEPAEAAHVKYADPMRGKDHPGIGRKSHDMWTVPLCPSCHRNGKNCQHQHNERVWWEQHRIDPLAVAERLYAASRQGRDRGQAQHSIVESMRAIVRRGRRGTL
jgi:hypothetical protein